MENSRILSVKYGVKFQEALQEIVKEFSVPVSVHMINSWPEEANVKFVDFEIDYISNKQIFKQQMKKFIVKRALNKCGKVLNPITKMCDYNIDKTVDMCCGLVQSYVSSEFKKKKQEQSKKTFLESVEFYITEGIVKPDELVVWIKEICAKNIIES